VQDLHWARQLHDDTASGDIALDNLRSAVGLPGPAVDEREIPPHLNKLDAWASLVRTGTERMLPKFRQTPDQYEGTLGKFQMLVLVTVLQRNLGVTYNRRFSEGEYDGSDPRNLFLHGVLTGFGGTCVTMPLLYIAIGRRLGYPLFLVETKEHFFVRWEGAGERFNIDATSPGFVSRDTDDYYREWPR
jgi:regulator of sirC expression with transglutaminase-like and TPR domain